MIDEHDPNEDGPRCAICGGLMHPDPFAADRWLHDSEKAADHVAVSRDQKGAVA